MTAPDPSLVSTDPVLIPLFAEKGIRASVLRLDKIHPVISGNKFFKLHFYLEEAKQTGKDHIITYGGAWSNHIVATAAACKLNGFRSTGIIRGEEPAVLSATLKDALDYGMKLEFLSREDFTTRKRAYLSPSGSSYIIPEGGYGLHGARGAATILQYVPDISNYTHICCAAGTGTMTAGLLSASDRIQKIVSVSVLKNNQQLDTDIRSLSGDANKPALISHDHHFGGYAKHTAALLSFMNDFFRQTTIPSDIVYTGKLFYAILDMVKKDQFVPGSKFLLIHSGGLQGNRSLNKGTLIF